MPCIEQEQESHSSSISPVKPVNLLPEIPVQSGSRKLNER
jgi:hypothetical protein